MQNNYGYEQNDSSIRETLIVVIMSIVITTILFYLKYPPRLPYADEFEYLGFAYGLFEFGVFGQVKDAAVKPDSTMFFPPLYPYFLSILMSLDHTFATTAKCFLTNLGSGSDGALTTAGCKAQYGLAIPVQIVIAGLAPVFVWATARRLSGSAKIAIFAAILALATKSYVYYANHFLTEALTLPLAAAFGWAMVAAWQERTIKYVAISAVLFGLLIHTRAGWGYVSLVVIPVYLWMSVSSWHVLGLRAIAPLAIFIAILSAVLSPWVIRNVVMFETPALTGGYGAQELSYRLPYNRMTNDEWKAAFVYWLPDFGDSLAAKIYPEDHYRRLAFSAPDGFYKGGRSILLKDSKSKKGDQDLFDYFIEHEIIGNLATHTKVTMAMVWRGMWVGKYWGLVTWMFFFPLLIFALYHKWGALIVLSLPPLFLLGLHGFVSVSIPRYNLTLIPVLAFSAAYVISHGVARIRARFKDPV